MRINYPYTHLTSDNARSIDFANKDWIPYVFTEIPMTSLDNTDFKTTFNVNNLYDILPENLYWDIYEIYNQRKLLLCNSYLHIKSLIDDILLEMISKRGGITTLDITQLNTSKVDTVIEDRLTTVLNTLKKKYIGCNNYWRITSFYNNSHVQKFCEQSRYFRYNQFKKDGKFRYYGQYMIINKSLSIDLNSEIVENTLVSLMIKKDKLLHCRIKHLLNEEVPSDWLELWIDKSLINETDYFNKIINNIIDLMVAKKIKVVFKTNMSDIVYNNTSANKNILKSMKFSTLFAKETFYKKYAEKFLEYLKKAI